MLLDSRVIVLSSQLPCTGRDFQLQKTAIWRSANEQATCTVATHRGQDEAEQPLVRMSRSDSSQSHDNLVGPESLARDSIRSTTILCYVVDTDNNTSRIEASLDDSALRFACYPGLSGWGQVR